MTGCPAAIAGAPDMPDFTEWFMLEYDDEGDALLPDFNTVLRRWHDEAGVRLLPRFTFVNGQDGEWMCLDAWKWPEGIPCPDQVPERTEADIPVGFA